MRYRIDLPDVLTFDDLDEIARQLREGTPEPQVAEYVADQVRAHLLEQAGVYLPAREAATV